MNYIIYSPGRTGSITLADELARLNPKHRRLYYDFDGMLTGEFILHTHDPTRTVPSKSDTIALISRRADQFAGAISALIAEHTVDYSDYKQAVPVTSFTVEKNKFISTLRSRHEFYQLLNLAGYTTVIDVWFTELIQDPYYLHKLLGISGEMQYTRIKSPYSGNNARFLIRNYNELVEFYQEIKHELC